MPHSDATFHKANALGGLRLETILPMLPVCTDQFVSQDQSFGISSPAILITWEWQIDEESRHLRGNYV